MNIHETENINESTLYSFKYNGNLFIGYLTPSWESYNYFIFKPIKMNDSYFTVYRFKITDLQPFEQIQSNQIDFLNI